MTFHHRNVIVTGGLGFIGSNLAIRLVELGARVTIVDSMVEGCGSNPHNIAPIADRVEVLECSIGDTAQLATVLRSCDVVFNLAGEISHSHSMLFPDRDLEINTLAQLRFVQACVEHNRGVRILYAGTRQVYGVPEYLPVDEKHPVNPVDFNGVHKYAATQYHLMLSRTGDLDAVVIRLTNVYGPRMAINIPCQGFLSTFVRMSLTKQRLDIFGDGEQLRDPAFIDDVVDAMIRVAAEPKLRSRSYNVGGPEALSLAEIARESAQAAGAPEPVFREFPADRKAIDIGSYHTDCNLIANQVGWRPQVKYADGFARTLAYYEKAMPHYIDPNDPNPACSLLHCNKSKAGLQTVAR